MYAQYGLQLANGSDRGKVTITATYLEIIGHGYASPSLTADLAVAGANGLDTGAEAANTWYAVHVINSTAGGPIASLLSLSAGSPTLPSGYNNSRRIGWVRNNGSSNLYRFTNAAGDHWFFWNEATNSGDFRVLAVTTSATVYTDVSCAAVAPPTCREVEVNPIVLNAVGRFGLRNKDHVNAPSQYALYNTAINGFALYCRIGCDASQVVQYLADDSTQDSYLDVKGYRDIR